MVFISSLFITKIQYVASCIRMTQNSICSNYAAIPFAANGIMSFACRGIGSDRFHRKQKTWSHCNSVVGFEIPTLSFILIQLGKFGANISHRIKFIKLRHLEAEVIHDLFSWTKVCENLIQTRVVLIFYSCVNLHSLEDVSYTHWLLSSLIILHYFPELIIWIFFIYKNLNQSCFKF